METISKPKKKPGHSVSYLQGEERRCYLTGRVDNLHKHHIFGGPRRKMSDRNGFWVWLTAEWHNEAPYSVHRYGYELRRRIQRDCERKYLKNHTMAQWMALVGKNYLLEEETHEQGNLDGAADEGSGDPNK